MSPELKAFLEALAAEEGANGSDYICTKLEELAETNKTPEELAEAVFDLYFDLAMEE